MYRILCVCGISILLGLLFAVCRHEAGRDREKAENPQRIVSLAPAITETLYALGLGDRIAGVTQFCAWPPEARNKPKVGGFRELSLEAILRSGADLVILPVDMVHFKKLIEDLGVPVLVFNYRTLGTFLTDIRKLGQLTSHEAQAKELAAGFENVIKEEKAGKKPDVLFVIMNPDEYDRPISELTIMGDDGFYNEMIRAAGGQNAYRGNTPFPRISLEAIIGMDPDIIIVGSPELEDIDTLKKLWQKIGHLRGAQDNRLVIFNDPGDTIPGPRSLGTLKKMKDAINAVKNAEQADAPNPRM